MSQKYRSLFTEFVKNVPDDRKRPQDFSKIQQQFAKNKENQHLTRSEKNTTYLEHQNEKHNHQQENNQNSQQKVEVSSFNRSQKIKDNYLKKQNSQSKQGKLKSSLSSAIQLQNLKQDALLGNKQAGLQAEHIQENNAFKKLQGQKVRDDIAKINRTIKNDKQQERQQQKKQQTQQKLKEVQQLVKSGMSYPDAKKQVFGNIQSHSFNNQKKQQNNSEKK